MTTNLDNVLERLYELCGVDLSHILSVGREITNYRQLKSRQESFLIKLHGDHQKQEGRVLLTKEYDEVYAEGSLIRDEATLLCRIEQFTVSRVQSWIGQNFAAHTSKSLKQIKICLGIMHSWRSTTMSSERVARENFLAARAYLPYLVRFAA